VFARFLPGSEERLQPIDYPSVREDDGPPLAWTESSMKGTQPLLTGRPRLWLVVATVLYVSVLQGCVEESVSTDFVARVGAEMLLEEDLSDMLASIPIGRDSTAIRKQLVDRWVVNALLEQEARRIDLPSDPEVRRLLDENEHSVLVSAYVNRLYEENEIDPTSEEAARFFEVNKERLRLREPFAMIRYLANTDRDSVMAARRALQLAMRGPYADSLWLGIVSRYAADPAGSLALSENHFAESRLLVAFPAVREVLLRLGEREMSRVIRDADQYHLVQVINRVTEGSIPEMRWVEDEIRRQLILQGRKQTFARTVQNLRNMATARNDLEVRIRDDDEGQ
jgi:hypothetical protein